MPQQRPTACYICGEDHFWRYCTKKCCPICDGKGHSISNCQRKKFSGTKSRIMQVSDRLPSELSVLLLVKLENTPMKMILDSGAGPSILDIGTVRELGLENSIRRRVGTVYGVGQNPVHLMGNITLEIDIGDDQIVRHSFGVLQDPNKTCILGRDLLRKFGSTGFDWNTQRIRLGSVWKVGTL